jgi:hypothetical protein
MPLVKSALDTAIKSQLEPLIETKTKDAFEKGLLEFQTQLRNNTKPVSLTIINEAIKAAAIVFSQEMKPLAADISKSVSDNVDTYIKTGTVNVLVTGVTIGMPSPHVITAQPGIGTIS